MGAPVEHIAESLYHELTAAIAETMILLCKKGV